MERIKEKPTLGERVKEKAVSAPKELLHKGLDDGSERLRTQLRDTAQQGRRDEYGGDAIEDTAASGLRRAEKELLKQRKKKNAEQSASPQGDASAPSSNSDVPPVIHTREAEAARVSTPPPPAQEQARQAAMKQAVKTKNAYISARGETTVTAAPEPQRQGQQAFIQEQGRKASRQQVQRRQAEQRFRHQVDLRGDPLRSEYPTSRGRELPSRERIKERGSIQPPKKHRLPEPKAPEHAAGIMPKVREGGKSAVQSAEQAVRSSTAHATAAGTHAAREAAMQMALRQQTTKTAETAVQKTAQAAGRALRGSRSAAASSRRRNIGSPNRKHRSTPQGSCRKSVKVANLPCSPPNRLCAPPPPMRLRPEHTLPEKQPCRWPCGNRRQKRQKPRCRKPHRRQAVRCALSLPLPRAYLQQ